MSHTDNTKAVGKVGGLAEMLAKQKETSEMKKEASAEEIKHSELTLQKASVIAATHVDNRVASTREVEAKLPDDPPTPEFNFRVFNHRYEFKVKDRVLKPDEKNIYTPLNSEEFNFLRLQVERGNIHFY